MALRSSANGQQHCSENHSPNANLSPNSNPCCLYWPSYTCKLKFYFFVPHTDAPTQRTNTHTRAHTPSSRRHIKKFICRDATAVATLATLSLSAHIILIRQCPTTPPSALSLPCHSSCWCCLLLLLVVLVVVAAACHLMEFAAYALRMPGIILSTAAFRFLWNLRLCFESSLPLLPLHSLLLVYFLFLFLLLACGLLSKVDMLPAWLKVFSACLLFCAPSIWLHTHTHTLTRRLMYVSWLTRFYWPSCLLVFCTLSNFDGLGRVSFPSAFFRGNLIYACKSSWQAALRSLGKLKSSARVFVRMLIVCLASRLSRKQLYSETYSQLPISLCLPCKAEEHVF